MINLKENEHYYTWLVYGCSVSDCDFTTLRKEELWSHYVKEHPERIEDPIKEIYHINPK